MGIADNPWLLRFKDLHAVDHIRARVELRPDPITGLEKEPSGVVESDVGKALSQFYRPSEQELAILQYLLERSIGHAKLAYPDRREYTGRLYSSAPNSVSPSPPVCLLGPAGIGKSQLAKAFLRLLPDDCEIDVDHYHKNMPLQGAWLVTANPRESVLQSLQPHLGQSESDARKGGHARVIRAATSIAYRNGISQILVDETQFMVGSDKTARITNTLLELGRVGVPVVYVANYSLWRALSNSHPQITQRLLTNPWALLPDPPDSEDWTGYLMECSRVLGRYLDEDLSLRSNQLFDMTAGLKRLVVFLMQGAFRIAWTEGRQRVAWRDIGDSYRSSPYTIPRREVTVALNRFERTKHSLDYECPIEISSEQARVLEEVRKRRSEHTVAANVLRSSIPVSQRDALSREDASCSPKRETRDKAPPRTANSLMDSASRLLGGTRSK